LNSSALVVIPQAGAHRVPGSRDLVSRRAWLPSCSFERGMNPEHQTALTQAQREELRRTLETKRSQLLSALREHEDLEEERDEREPGDAADLAEVAIEDHDRISKADRDLELLEEVDHALTRLDAGTYGLSEASGRPISFARLRAVPWARYDAEEAERVEHAARH
jgi:DnaK suppressor protein